MDIGAHLPTQPSHGTCGNDYNKALGERMQCCCLNLNRSARYLAAMAQHGISAIRESWLPLPHQLFVHLL